MSGQVKEICDVFLLKLRTFPLFEENNKFYGFSNASTGSTYLGYWTNPDQRELNQTKLYLQITGDICYILDVGIERKDRRKGYGTILNDCIENIGRAFNCRIAQVTPSGEGVPFWPKMGYQPINKKEYQKLIK